jgi:hypothetical protein
MSFSPKCISHCQALDGDFQARSALDNDGQAWGKDKNVMDQSIAVPDSTQGSAQDFFFRYLGLQLTFFFLYVSTSSVLKSQNEVVPLLYNHLPFGRGKVCIFDLFGGQDVHEMLVKMKSNGK